MNEHAQEAPTHDAPTHDARTSDAQLHDAQPHDRHPLNLAHLQRRLVDFAAARGWWPHHTPKNLAAALSVEASELLEIFQWLTPEQSERVMADPESAHRVRDEVADVLAYLLQLCERLDVDLLTALDEKIDRNESRFPLPAPAHEPAPAPEPAPKG
ncbi:NTP pyrophosphatase (non-canonical NTP hydrolase) [Streptomyces sp. B3I8]|nr:NTP pyrophosphatase (non-canonical NTP hydrolase) [Streptomyces sp. B3I8]